MQETLTTAVAYYTALGKKNMQEVRRYLHPEIEFTDPQERVIGKESVLKAAEGFLKIFATLTILEKFGSPTHAMIVYEVEIPHFSKKLRAASLLSFRDGLISKIELFYDTRVFSERN